MIKLTAVFLSITIFITGTIHGQTLSQSSKQKHPNLRESIAEQTEKINSQSAEIDVKKLEKIERQTPNKSNWNNKKTLLIVTIAALVGLAVVLALTTKRCIKRSPSNCSFTEDTNCECLEYAE